MLRRGHASAAIYSNAIHHRPFTARKRQRPQRLAICRLAKRRSLARRLQPSSVLPLRYRRVVDNLIGKRAPPGEKRVGRSRVRLGPIKRTCL